jgi:hypothetical protein
VIRDRRSRALLLAFLTGVCFLGPPQQARAGLQVTLSEAGYATQNVSVSTLSDGTQVASFSGSYGDFLFDNLVVTSTSGVTGANPRGAELTDTQFSLRSSLASGTGTLTVTVKDDGFLSTAPNTSLLLESSLTNQIMSNADSSSFHSSINGTSDGVLQLTGLGAVAEATNMARGSNATYTVANVMTIKLAAGDDAQVTGKTVVTPAPPGLALALTGLPLLGFGCWRRWHPKKRNGQ